MAELELYRIRKSYDSNIVVNDVSLKLPAGKLLTLLGPSGCGKSTTLRIIAGLTSADAGIVRIGTRDVTSVHPAKRNLGMVFQSLALFPHMTVTENIEFGLRVQGVSAEKRKNQIRSVLELTRMTDYAERFPSQISGGQRQRVALARAIVFSPDILLLDEPFSALDRKLRDEMQHELRALVNRIGVTTVFVTHDQEEAIRLSDYVAVMKDGSIEQLDRPEQVYNNPATAFVADFMGAVNFIEVKVENVNGKLAHVRAQDSVFDVPFAADSRPASGDVMRFNIRPERISLSDSRPDAAPALKAHIVDKTFEGAFTSYQVRLAGSDVQWTIREVAGRNSPALVHNEVWVTWDLQQGHLIRFEPESAG